MTDRRCGTCEHARPIYSKRNDPEARKYCWGLPNPKKIDVVMALEPIAGEHAGADCPAWMAAAREARGG